MEQAQVEQREAMLLAKAAIYVLRDRSIQILVDAHIQILMDCINEVYLPGDESSRRGLNGAHQKAPK